MLYLERLLMSRMFRRYIECAIVVWAPWVLLFEQPAATMEELEGREEHDNETQDVYLHSRALPRNGNP